MIRFYAPEATRQGILPESDSAHCVRVLRLREGDKIETVDGRGKVNICTITDANPKKVAIKVVESREEPNFWRGKISVAMAPTKNADRMEWALEKMVEFGIDNFIPIRCEHSERKNVNIERLQKIAVSAMKQSLKAVLPVVEPLTDFKKFITGSNSTKKYICYCDDSTPRQELVKILPPEENVTVLIGPEGDFSPVEVEFAISHGFVPVTLGEARLRTETAAIAACCTFHFADRS